MRARTRVCLYVALQPYPHTSLTFPCGAGRSLLQPHQPAAISLGWAKTLSQTRSVARARARTHTHARTHEHLTAPGLRFDRATGWHGTSCTQEGITRRRSTAQSAKQTRAHETVADSVQGARRSLSLSPPTPTALLLSLSLSLPPFLSLSLSLSHLLALPLSVLA